MIELMTEIAEIVSPGKIEYRKNRIKKLMDRSRYGSPEKVNPIIVNRRRSREKTIGFRWI